MTTPLVARSRSAAEEGIARLKKGATVLKHGRSGDPQKTLFHLSADERSITWTRQGLAKFRRKSIERQVQVSDIVEVLIGHESEVFKRHGDSAGAAHLSFSLVLRRALPALPTEMTEDGDLSTQERQTLDLSCSDEESMGMWLAALRSLMEHPFASRRDSAGGQPQQSASSGPQPASTALSDESVPAPPRASWSEDEKRSLGFESQPAQDQFGESKEEEASEVADFGSAPEAMLAVPPAAEELHAEPSAPMPRSKVGTAPCKFSFQANDLNVTLHRDRHEGKLVIAFKRGGSRQETEPIPIKEGMQESDGSLVRMASTSQDLALIVTMFRQREGAFESKEAAFTLTEQGPDGKDRKLGTAHFDLRDYADATSVPKPLDLKFGDSNGEVTATLRCMVAARWLRRTSANAADSAQEGDEAQLEAPVDAGRDAVATEAAMEEVAALVERVAEEAAEEAAEKAAAEAAATKVAAEAAAMAEAEEAAAVSQAVAELVEEVVRLAAEEVAELAAAAEVEVAAAAAADEPPAADAAAPAGAKAAISDAKADAPSVDSGSPRRVAKPNSQATGPDDPVARLERLRMAGQNTEQWETRAGVVGDAKTQRADAIRRLSSLGQLPTDEAEPPPAPSDAAAPVQRAEAMRSLSQTFVAGDSGS